jgi:hypothetical protein
MSIGYMHCALPLTPFESERAREREREREKFIHNQQVTERERERESLLGTLFHDRVLRVYFFHAGCHVGITSGFPPLRPPRVSLVSLVSGLLCSTRKQIIKSKS